MNMDEIYMQRCLQLALLAAGNVAPNPMVGSVLVYENRIIGEGYHQQYGEAHAEVNCIRSVAAADQHLIEKSTLYVSLEPCNHAGKTPACTELIIQSNIRKVVIGCSDTSDKVDGNGIQKLKQHGIEVTTNVLENDCMELNKRFFHFEKNKLPYVILKWAESADGLIAKNHERTKISNQFTDRTVHQWRTEEAAIMVGYKTALTDDPQLNVRLAKGNNPVRIVIDPLMALPSHLHLFDQSQPSIIFNGIGNKVDGQCEWIQINGDNTLTQLLRILYQKKILSVMVEGGGKLLQQFMDSNLWNEARIIKSNQFLYEGIKAPVLKNAIKTYEKKIGSDVIYYHQNKLQQL